MEYSREITLCARQADFNGRLKASALLEEFQQAAEENAAQMGFARSTLVQRGVVWVLYALRVEMERWPEVGETVTIHTWPAGLEKLFFLRHFTVWSGGVCIGGAYTQWVLMDIEKRQLCRPDRLPPVPAHTQLEAPAAAPGKIAKMTGPGRSFCRQVQCSDLDFNRHMNNARYADWMCDAFAQHTLADRRPAAFSIHFRKECHGGQNLTILCEEPDGRSFHMQGRDGENVHFDIAGTWEQI